jgi:four helix bundle protein
MSIRNFEGLVCWRLSHELKCEVLAVIALPPAARDFDFCTQIRKSSRSAPANISEGFGRYVPRDFANYLRIAKASLQETRNHLIDARDRGYVRDPLYSRLVHLACAAERATTGLLVQKLRQAAVAEETNRERRPRQGLDKKVGERSAERPPRDRGDS